MLLSLKSLSLRHRIRTSKNFQDVCSFFPNLESLDLAYTAIERLKACNLISLVMAIFLTSRILKILISLKPAFVGIQSELSKRTYAPKLRHLDLSYSSVKEEAIRKLVEAHPTLESLSSSVPRTPTFNSTTLQAATEALKFYSAENNAFYFLRIVMILRSKCCEKILKMAPLNTYNQDDLVQMLNFVITCNSPRVKLIDSHYLADRATYTLWNVLNNGEVLLNTPHIDLNQICRLYQGPYQSKFGNVPIGTKKNNCESRCTNSPLPQYLGPSGGHRCSRAAFLIC
ncbi:unnamed protein product [Caenorhabditis nigoni]